MKNTSGEHIVNLTAYSVIKQMYIKPGLDFVETTFLKLLREGLTISRISDILNINPEPVICGLAFKKILNKNATFRYKDIDDWFLLAQKEYKRGYVFFDIEKNSFFNKFIYPNELKFSEGFILRTYLENEYISENVLNTMLVIKSFNVRYNPAGLKQSYPIKRKIAEHESEYFNYIYKGCEY